MSERGISISEWQRDRIQKLDRLGYKPGEIVEAMDISYQTVARWRRRDNTEDKPRKPPERPPAQTPEQIEDEVVRLRCEGVRTGEIARRMDLHVNTVANICKRRDVWLLQV